MKVFEHLNFEKRKIIANCLSHKKKAIEIAELIYCDPSAVSKELKRNRRVSKEAIDKRDPICKKTLRFPYVCNGCDIKYLCHKKQYRYEVSIAQREANYRLVSSRAGINLSQEEFEILDKKIKDGIINKESIYHIIKNNDDISISISTAYRYINKGLLTTKRVDLPLAVKYKKRKKNKKEYEYCENKNIDRNNRTYLDYLSYIRFKPNLFVTQMDFLGSIKTDTKSILTLTIPNLHFCLIFLVIKKNSTKMMSLFDELEILLGIDDFKKVFPVILTDRDPSFSDFMTIEYSPITGEERTRVFYCDPFKSSQKGNVENMNKQLRRYFPKKSSIDNLSLDYIKKANIAINSLRIASLSGSSPEQAFIEVYGKEILDKLYNFSFSNK